MELSSALIGRRIEFFQEFAAEIFCILSPFQASIVLDKEESRRFEKGSKGCDT